MMMDKNMKILLIDIIQYIIIIILGVVCVLQSIRNKNDVQELQEFVTEKGDYNQVYFDMKLSELKKANEELYDSIQKYKDIEYALRLELSKKYQIDTIKTDSIKPNEHVNVYTFENNPNDSIHYMLQLGSTVKPKWYTLDLKIHETLFLYNRKQYEVNQAIIDSKNNFEITDATFYHKPTKKKFKDRFVFGPQLNVGYDVFRGNLALTVGVGITFDCTK